MKRLPVPEVLRSYFDEGFHPPLPAMWLRWKSSEQAPGERIWYLPEGVTIVGPAPERFGISVQRHRPDVFSVRLIWDRTTLSWSSLTRTQLMTCALEPLLRVLGTDLQHLLEQAGNLKVHGRLAA
jgi:hypothetical protein